MIDGNENMRMGKLANILKKEPLNMRDEIRDRVETVGFQYGFVVKSKWTLYGHPRK